MNWFHAIDIIKNNHRFAITSHVGLDGDAVGSCVALASYLTNCGKKATIVYQDTVPESLRFLLNGNQILSVQDPTVPNILAQCDAVFVLDVSNRDHIGATTDQYIHDSGKHIICIDHHKCDAPLGEYSFMDTTACSTGVLIYDLCKQYDESLIDTPIASALYTTILTDTGNFRFSNTTADTYRVAAELLNKNINHTDICHNIHENYSWNRFYLLHKVLATLTREADGKIAWMKITRAILEQTHGTYEDTDGFVDMPRTIRDVEVSILFRELDSQTSKATFRSKNYVDVSRLASVFGGGGHARAAGATLQGTIDEVIEKVVSKTKEFISDIINN